MKNAKRAYNRERGVALIMVLAVLVVISLGILAFVNGVENMQRSAVQFGRSDEAYNAAIAGLSVARGYIAGLAPETTPGANDISDGSVGSGVYSVAISCTADTAHSDPDWVELAPAPGQPLNVTKYKKDTVTLCTVTSTGTCNNATRILRNDITITRRQIKTVTTVTETYTPPATPPPPEPYVYSTYDILSGGSMGLTGNVDAGDGSVLHTNQDFSASGSVNFGTAYATGTAETSGSVDGSVTSGVAPVAVPTVNWEAAKDPGYTEIISGNLTLNGSTVKSPNPPGKQNLYVMGNMSVSGSASLTGYKNLFVEGDLNLSGSMTAHLNIYAKGRVTISGKTKIFGVVYSAYELTENDAIKISGNAHVTGGLIAKGTVNVSGNVFTGSVEQRNEANIVITVPGDPPPPPPPTETTKLIEEFEDTQFITDQDRITDVSS